MKKDEMIITNENGEEEIIKVLQYFKFNSGNNKYIIYTRAKKGLTTYNIYSAEIIETNDEIMLKSIDDEEVINKIRKVLGE